MEVFSEILSFFEIQQTGAEEERECKGSITWLHDVHNEVFENWVVDIQIIL